jgi:hypothetical protein
VQLQNHAGRQNNMNQGQIDSHGPNQQLADGNERRNLGLQEIAENHFEDS